MNLCTQNGHVSYLRSPVSSWPDTTFDRLGNYYGLLSRKWNWTRHPPDFLFWQNCCLPQKKKTTQNTDLLAGQPPSQKSQQQRKMEILFFFLILAISLVELTFLALFLVGIDWHTRHESGIYCQEGKDAKMANIDHLVPKSNLVKPLRAFLLKSTDVRLFQTNTDFYTSLHLKTISSVSTHRTPRCTF